MRNASDDIIYVGKAINLKKRVRQYFDNNKNKGAKVLAMVSHIDHFEYIIVENEVEALVLESNLIKKNRPKYNIVLRDDKQYPYIKITNEKFPRIQKVRLIKNDKANYYGPYPDAYAVNDSIDLFHLYYPFRTCNLDFDKGQRLDRPCLNYFIKKCKGPCIGDENEKRYMENIDDLKGFLEKNNEKIPNWVLDKMNKASSELNFEMASIYRDYYRALATISQRQKVTETKGADIDIIAMSKGSSAIVMQVFFMRQGKIVDREHFIIKNDYLESDEDILSSFLKQFYLDIMYVPQEILIEYRPNDIETIARFLSQKRGKKVNIHKPKLGNKKDLLNMAFNNANDMRIKYEKQLEKKERKKSAGIKQLKEILNIGEIKRIECYDISNTSGVRSVGSMVVFIDGHPDTKEYRKFKIKTIEGPDDYGSLREVLDRRFKNGLDELEKGNTQTGFGAMPDLILMDGGKGQVSSAIKIRDQYKLDIEIAGLVKDDKHTTRAIIYNNEEIPINRRDPVYKLIYEIQEEAHRFAINYHRKLMQKSMQKSELDNIKGVGEKTRNNLYKYFKTIDKIKKASVEELMQVPLVGKKQALEIYKYFRLNGWGEKMDSNKNENINTAGEIIDDDNTIIKEVNASSENSQIKLSQLVDNLGLEIVHKSSDYENITLSSADVNRPGLQLTGYLEEFPYQRLQIIGAVEYTYLTGLDSKLQYERFRGILSYNIPAVIFSYDAELNNDILDLVDYYDKTLLRSPSKTTKLISDISDELEYLLAPRSNVHGELLEVFGIGVLIMGKSSVGKSETALDLVKRGHRLVADDMVDIIAIDNKLTGSAPDNIRHYMEIRGLGIVNVRRLYGTGSVKKDTEIDLVIELEQWKNDYEYDRLGIDDHYVELLDVKVPYILIPVRAGRNLAMIVEVAAMNQREKNFGYNAARVMTNNIFHKDKMDENDDL